MEKGITVEYLTALHAAYEAFLAVRCPFEEHSCVRTSLESFPLSKSIGITSRTRRLSCVVSKFSRAEKVVAMIEREYAVNGHKRTTDSTVFAKHPTCCFLENPRFVIL